MKAESKCNMQTKRKHIRRVQLYTCHFPNWQKLFHQYKIISSQYISNIKVQQWFLRQVCGLWWGQVSKVLAMFWTQHENSKYISYLIYLKYSCVHKSIFKGWDVMIFYKNLCTIKHLNVQENTYFCASLFGSMQHLLASFHVDEVEQINMTEPANRWKSQVNQAVAKSKHRSSLHTCVPYV